MLLTINLNTIMNINHDKEAMSSLTTITPAPGGFTTHSSIRRTKARPYHDPSKVVKDYLNPVLLNTKGTLSPALRHLSPKTQYMIASELRKRDLRELREWTIDNEMPPTGKDPRHDRASSLASRYYSTFDDSEPRVSYEDSLELTRQQLYITSGFNQHTSRYSEVNAILSQALRIWTYTGGIFPYSHLRRLHSEGKSLTFPNGTHCKRRRILLASLAREYASTDPVFSSLCSDALSSGQMFQRALDSVSDTVVTSLFQSATRQASEARDHVVTNATQAVAAAPTFIKSICDSIISCFAKVKEYFSTVSHQLVGFLAPLTPSFILLAVFLSITAFFTSWAVIKSFTNTYINQDPLEACLKETDAFDMSGPQYGQSFFRSTFADNINGTARLINSSKTIIQSFSALWDVVLDAVDVGYVRLTGKPFTTRGQDKVDAATHYNGLVDNCEKFTTDPNDYQSAASFIRSYKELTANHKNTIFVPSVGAAVLAALNKYQPWFQKAKSILSSSSARAPATVIALRGVPNAGKSTIISALTDRLSTVLNVPDTTYNRNFTQKHWDGYRNQTFCVFDDFLLSKDVTTRAEECDNLIRVNNTSPFPLNMASLEDKDSTFFTSIVVILTTNASLDFSDCGITDKRAVARRITYIIDYTHAMDQKLLKNSLADAVKHTKADVSRYAGMTDDGKVLHNKVLTGADPQGIIDYIVGDYTATKQFPPLKYKDILRPVIPPSAANAAPFVPSPPPQGPQQGNMHTREKGKKSKEKSRKSVEKVVEDGYYTADELELEPLGVGSRSKMLPRAIETPGFSSPDIEAQPDADPFLSREVTSGDYRRTPNPVTESRYHDTVRPATVSDRLKVALGISTAGEVRLETSAMQYLSCDPVLVPNHTKTPVGGPIRDPKGDPDHHNMSTHMDIAKVQKLAWQQFVLGSETAARVALASVESNPKIMCDEKTAYIYWHMDQLDYLDVKLIPVKVKSHLQITEGAFFKPIGFIDYSTAKENYQQLFYRLLMAGKPSADDSKTAWALAQAFKTDPSPFDPKYLAVPVMADIIGKPMFPMTLTLKDEGSVITMVPAPILEYWRRIWNLAHIKQYKVTKTESGYKSEHIPLPIGEPLSAASAFGTLRVGPSQLYLQVCAGNYERTHIGPNYYVSPTERAYFQIKSYYEENVAIRSWSYYKLHFLILSTMIASLIGIICIFYAFFSKTPVDTPSPTAIQDVLVGQSWPDERDMSNRLGKMSRAERRKAINAQKAAAIQNRNNPLPQAAFDNLVHDRLKSEGQAFDYGKAALYASSLRKIEFVDDLGVALHQHVLGLTGGVCLTLLHGLKIAEKAGYSIRLVLAPNNYYKTTFKELRDRRAILEVPDRDLAVVVFEHHFSRNIIKHFGHQPESNLRSAVRVGFAPGDWSKYIYTQASCDFRQQTTYTVGNDTLSVSEVYGFNMPGQAGMCSTPYVSSVTGNIIGIHSAGSDVYSTFTSITHSQIIAWIRELDVEYGDQIYLHSRSPLPKELNLKGESAIKHDPFKLHSIHVVGTTPFKHFSPTDSDIWPSALHNSFGPVKTKRAHLYKTPSGLPVFSRWCEKNAGKTARCVYPGMTATHNWDGVFPPTTHGLTYRQFTFDEVVDGCDVLPPLERTRSPGYPWVVRGLSRAQVLDHHRDELKKQVEAHQKRLLAGKVPRTLYTLIPKDEVRPEAKVDAGDTRFVQVAELSILILNKMYFGWFLVIHSTHFMETDIMVGMNPYGLDWDVFSRRLSLDFCSDKDVSRWDINFPINFCMQFPYQAAIRYKGIPVLILRLIFVCTFHCNVLYCNIIFEFDGMPSGDLKTAHLNSAVNSAGNRSVFNEQPFKFALGVTGDDVVSSHEDGFDLDKANSQLSLRFGWEITDAAKGGTPTAKDLSECQFLKRGFSYQGNRWLAPLDTGSIQKMLQWVHAKTAPQAVERTFENWDVAIRELSLHPKAVFDTYQNLVLSELSSDMARVMPIKRSHEDLRHLVALTSIKY